jgi:membrane-associated protease RseP (regulator of RpoE activity)
MIGTRRNPLTRLWWSPGALAGALAALGFVLAPAVLAGPIPPPKPDKRDSSKKEEPRKDERQPANGAAGQANFDVEQAARLQHEVQRQMLEMQKRLGAMGPAGFRQGGFQEEGRLGVTVTKPGATLVDQLDLPRDQGLVLEQVPADSAAGKAGMKAHDILLELNGKAVPDDVRQLARQLQDVKPDKPITAVVLRKGQRETIEGLKLPEAASAAGVGNFPMPAPPGPVLQRFVPVAGHDGAAVGATVTTVHTGDQFTTRYQEGGLVIRVTGTTAGGTAKVGSISVTDNGKTEKYESVEKVPERYRDRVKSLVESSARTGVRIEIKAP